MTFNKTELEIISYCVDIMKCELVKNAPLESDFVSILEKLQKAGIWGRIETENFESLGDDYGQILEDIEVITENEGDFRCSTCDEVNDIVKNR